jgi:hypothetical protein
VPGDEFHRLDLQPSGIRSEGVLLGRDLEVRNEAYRGVRAGTLAPRRSSVAPE